MAKVFYFVGASGSGKDSVLNEFKQQLPENLPIHIAQRYITRPADYGGETHIALSEQAFASRLLNGDFIMHWQANNYRYAIENNLHEFLDNGVSVLFNGSREQIPQAQAVFQSKLQVITLHVNKDTLLKRLQGRGRESEEVIAARLARHRELQDKQVNQGWLLDNNGPLESTVQHLIGYIQQQMEP